MHVVVYTSHMQNAFEVLEEIRLCIDVYRENFRWYSLPCQVMDKREQLYLSRYNSFKHSS